MAQFREMCFTPAEFAAIAQIDRSVIPQLENQGIPLTVRKRFGSSERKVIPLENIQGFFQILRQSLAPLPPLDHHSDAEAQATPPASLLQDTLSPTQRSQLFPKHQVQMFYNVKGGTGKSTLTAQYAMKSAILGLKVLAIDLDGQGHLTVNLDILDAHERPSIYDVLINDLPLGEAVMNIGPCLDLVPANLGLCTIEIPLNHKTRREYRLAEAIEEMKGYYDLIVADTNPAASILNGSMLVAADLVNVVCATNPLSFHGMSLVMATIEDMEREFKKTLEIKIIPNLYDNREVISQEVLGELRSQFSQHCTQAVIHRSADLNEATKRRTTVWDVNSKGVAAQDIKQMTQELLFQ